MSKYLHASSGHFKEHRKNGFDKFPDVRFILSSLLLYSLNIGKRLGSKRLSEGFGEIVFDKLLIKQLQADKITFAVRGKPVINDATIDDAVATGITELVEVIDNGSDAPGTVLEECSGKFRRSFQDADLIIAKGQGNFETLSGVDKKIFFCSRQNVLLLPATSAVMSVDLLRE